MKQAERVRLQNLRQIHDSPQTCCVGRNADAQNRIASFRRGDQMADGTDPADTGHQRRHFIKWPVLAELLKTAELGNVELGIGHPAVVIQLDPHLGMTFDASYW